MDLAKGAVGVGMWSCWGEELVESGVGFLSPQKLAAGDRSVGGCHHVRIWTYWIPALLPSPSCNWATRLWPHSRVWKELLGLAGSLGRVKGAGGAWDPTCSLRSLELMLCDLVWPVSLSEPEWVSSCLEGPSGSGLKALAGRRGNPS